MFWNDYWSLWKLLFQLQVFCSNLFTTKFLLLDFCLNISVFTCLYVIVELNWWMVELIEWSDLTVIDWLIYWLIDFWPSVLLFFSSFRWVSVNVLIGQRICEIAIIRHRIVTCCCLHLILLVNKPSSYYILWYGSLCQNLHVRWNNNTFNTAECKTLTWLDLTWTLDLTPLHNTDLRAGHNLMHQTIAPLIVCLEVNIQTPIMQWNLDLICQVIQHLNTLFILINGSHEKG